jgi:diaminopimelate decarboxylase
MHDFKYKGKYLYCENVKLEDLAKEYGTPLYVYSYHTLIDHYRKLKEAFSPIDPLICYSLKANSNLAILKLLVDQGAGLDVVSGGELFRALRVGCLPDKIVYASVGKTGREIEDAIRRNILFFNVESFPELESINRISEELNVITQVAIRLNPDVEPQTHKFVATGKITAKFGIDFKTAEKIFSARKKFPHLTISGLHIHIGSQITESAPYVAAIKKILKFIKRLKKKGIPLECLNIGGGLGIVYDNETPQTAEKFARKVLPLLKPTGLKIIMEPGRFIAGNAGVLLTRILYLKKTPRKKFVVVDAGMNDLIRPALYGAHHTILPVTVHKGRSEKVDVVGPICESADFLADDRKLPSVKEGEVLAVMGAGAYGFSMSSNYNSRRRAAEVMVKGNKAYCIRKRETSEDLVRNEQIPEYE